MVEFKTVLFKVFSLYLLAVLCACNEKNEVRYTIGFSQCTGKDQWRKNMLDEMDMELSFNSDAQLILKDAAGNSRTQIEQVRELISQKVDLLIVSPNEADPLTPVVEEAYKKGIPVIVLDRKISSEKYTAFIGGDNLEIGRIAGKYLGKSLHAGRVLEIRGLKNSSPARDRGRGFAEGISSFKTIQIVSQVKGDWYKDIAKKELLKNKAVLENIDAVFAHNDQMALAAKEVLDSLGINKKVKIIGVDGQPTTKG